MGVSIFTMTDLSFYPFTVEIFKYFVILKSRKIKSVLHVPQITNFTF